MESEYGEGAWGGVRLDIFTCVGRCKFHSRENVTFCYGRYVAQR